MTKNALPFPLDRVVTPETAGDLDGWIGREWDIPNNAHKGKETNLLGLNNGLTRRVRLVKASATILFTHSAAAASHANGTGRIPYGDDDSGSTSAGDYPFMKFGVLVECADGITATDEADASTVKAYPSVEEIAGKSAASGDYFYVVVHGPCYLDAAEDITKGQHLMPDATDEGCVIPFVGEAGNYCVGYAMEGIDVSEVNTAAGYAYGAIPVFVGETQLDGLA